MKKLILKEYAAYIDHSSLLPTDNKKTIEDTCAESIENGYACVCIVPSTLAWTAEYLKRHNSDINISSAIAFPHGTTTTESKVFEAVQSCRMGANEIDMVMCVNQAKEGNWPYIEQEIFSVKKAILKVRSDAVLKVIVETCLLDRHEKTAACETCIKAGADYIKTSSGFSTGGATVEDIKLFNQISQGQIKIKASGGIKTAESFLAMIDAGAERIGTKFSKSILSELIQLNEIC